jgi:hypothetical protein
MFRTLDCLSSYAKSKLLPEKHAKAFDNNCHREDMDTANKLRRNHMS